MFNITPDFTFIFSSCIKDSKTDVVYPCRAMIRTRFIMASESASSRTKPRLYRSLKSQSAQTSSIILLLEEATMHRDLNQAQSSLTMPVNFRRNRKIKISVQLGHKLCFHATFVGFWI